MTAGYPHTVEFFKPDADMDTDKPEFTVPFVISVPSILINVSNAPSFDELVGFYEDGLMTITEFFVSDELRKSMAASAEAEDEDELGCDLRDIIPAIEAAVGTPNEFPFTISKTGENTGSLQTGDDEEGGFSLSYDPAAGAMTVHYEEEGMSFDGVLKAKYNADKTGVEILGDIVSDLGAGMENMRLTLQISGSKPLAE